MGLLQKGCYKKGKIEMDEKEKPPRSGLFGRYLASFLDARWGDIIAYMAVKKMRQTAFIRCSGRPDRGVSLMRGVGLEKRVVYQVVGEPEQLISKTTSHLRETLCLNQVVERKGREHSTIAMNLCLHKQRSSANTIERRLLVDALARLMLLRHQQTVRSHLLIPLKNYLILPHLLCHLQRDFRIVPRVIVIRADALLPVILVPLEAVGHDNGAVVESKVLDDARRGLNNIRVEPKHPACLRPDGREDKRVSSASHRGAASLLRAQRMAVFLILQRGRLEVLSQDRDAMESIRLLPGLHTANRILELA